MKKLLLNRLADRKLAEVGVKRKPVLRLVGDNAKAVHGAKYGAYSPDEENDSE